MPVRSTPDSLGVKLLVGKSTSPVFALCHPVDDGLPDRITSVVFCFDNGVSTPIRVFDTEIVSMNVDGNTLYCVDRLQKMYAFDGSNWTDFDNPSLVPYRINVLKTEKSGIYGVADDGMVFRWLDDNWVALTEEIEDLYLFDLSDWGDASTVICGEEGHLAYVEDGGIRVIEVPTNAALTSVLEISNQELLVTGRKATAFRLQNEQIVQLDAGARDLSFFNSVVWKDRILLSANSEVSEVVGDEIRVFSERRSGWLLSHLDKLWCQSDGACAFTLDGSDWTSVVFSADI